MATFRKRSGSWQGFVKKRFGQIGRIFETKAEAEAWAKIIEAESRFEKTLNLSHFLVSLYYGMLQDFQYQNGKKTAKKSPGIHCITRCFIRNKYVEIVQNISRMAEEECAVRPYFFRQLMILWGSIPLPSTNTRAISRKTPWYSSVTLSPGEPNDALSLPYKEGQRWRRFARVRDPGKVSSKKGSVKSGGFLRPKPRPKPGRRSLKRNWSEVFSSPERKPRLHPFPKPWTGTNGKSHPPRKGICKRKSTFGHGRSTLWLNAFSPL